MNEDVAKVTDIKLDAFDRMDDRELLLSIARDINAVKAIIGEAAQSFGPMLDNPMIKLLMKTMK